MAWQRQRALGCHSPNIALSAPANTHVDLKGARGVRASRIQAGVYIIKRVVMDRRDNDVLCLLADSLYCDPNLH